MICRTHFNHNIHDGELDWVKLPKPQRPAVRNPLVNRWRFITHGCGVTALVWIIAGVTLMATADRSWILLSVVGGPCLLGAWMMAAFMWMEHDDKELQLLSCLIHLPDGSNCSVSARISENQIEPFHQAGFRVQPC